MVTTVETLTVQPIGTWLAKGDHRRNETLIILTSEDYGVFFSTFFGLRKSLIWTICYFCSYYSPLTNADNFSVWQLLSIVRDYLDWCDYYNRKQRKCSHKSEMRKSNLEVFPLLLFKTESLVEKNDSSFDIIVSEFAENNLVYEYGRQNGERVEKFCLNLNDIGWRIDMFCLLNLIRLI